MTVLAVLTVLGSSGEHPTLLLLVHQIQHLEATAAVLTVLAVSAVSLSRSRVNREVQAVN